MSSAAGWIFITGILWSQFHHVDLFPCLCHENCPHKSLESSESMLVSKDSNFPTLLSTFLSTPNFLMNISQRKHFFWGFCIRWYIAPHSIVALGRLSVKIHVVLSGRMTLCICRFTSFYMCVRIWDTFTKKAQTWNLQTQTLGRANFRKLKVCEFASAGA